MVSAARKHNRIVQVGPQHRSAPHFARIAEIIQRGDIGDVKFVRRVELLQSDPERHRAEARPAAARRP